MQQTASYVGAIDDSDRVVIAFQPVPSYCNIMLKRSLFYIDFANAQLP